MVSTIKNKPTPTTTPTNTVATEGKADSAAAAAADEAAVDIGGLEVPTAAMPTTTTASTQAVVADITAEMRGLVITDAEAAHAVQQLKALPASEARAALGSLASSGALDTLTKQVPDGARSDLLGVMIRAGFVGSEKGSVDGTVGRAGPKPPQAPVFGKQSTELSPAVRQMVRDENMSRLDDFREQFNAYRDSYQQAVRGASSFEGLRALGPIAEPNLPMWEPGTHTDSDHDWSRKASLTPDTQTGKVLTDTIFRLNGKSPPGADFLLEGTVKMKLSEDVEVEYKGSAVESRSGARTVDGGVKVKVKESVVPGVKAVAHVSGTVTGPTEGGGSVKEALKGGVEIGVTGSSVTVVANAKEVELTIKAQGAEVKAKVNNDGAEGKAKALGFIAGGSVKTAVDDRGHSRTTAKATVGVENVTATAGMDSDGGLIAGVGIDTDNVELTMQVTVQLMSTEDFKVAFAQIDGDALSTPPELKRGVAWSQLGDDAQAAYTFLGWGKDAWQGEQKKSLSLASARIAGR